MARSSRSNVGLALAATLIVLAGLSASAHRRDEYLQAARIAVEPGRVEVQLDLTPGIALAEGILADIDRDRDGVIASAEAEAYAARVIGDVRLEIDARPVALRLISQRFPDTNAILKGEGTIELRFGASAPSLAAGDHRLSFQNDHRPDIGVYLANALAPRTPHVVLHTQRRDVNQRGLAIDYALAGGTRIPATWWLLAAALSLSAIAVNNLSRRSAPHKFRGRHDLAGVPGGVLGGMEDRADD